MDTEALGELTHHSWVWPNDPKQNTGYICNYLMFPNSDDTAGRIVLFLSVKQAHSLTSKSKSSSEETKRDAKQCFFFGKGGATGHSHIPPLHALQLLDSRTGTRETINKCMFGKLSSSSSEALHGTGRK